MCQGHSNTFFLCVPRYILVPTKYNTIHKAIIIYNASANQSALPRCLPESDRVPLCTCPAEKARLLAFHLYLYQPIYIQQIIIYDALTNQSALPLCLPESDRVPLCNCLRHNAKVLAFPLYLHQLIYMQQTIMLQTTCNIIV